MCVLVCVCAHVCVCVFVCVPGGVCDVVMCQNARVNDLLFDSKLCVLISNV